MQKIKELLEFGENKLKKVTKRARFEAEELLAFDIKKDRVFLHINFDKEIKINNYFIFLEQRAKFVPLEFITKRAVFFSREFYVDKNVLIPRSETEILVQKAIDLIKKHKIKKIAEIGTGSGIISIVLAIHFPEIKIIATDISKEALMVAKKNAKKFNITNIDFYQTSLLDNIDEKIDLLISNPPYISKSYPLTQDVLKEPHIALFGGEKGDELLKEIINLVFKKNIKRCALEMGYDQKKSLQDYLQKKGAKNIEFYEDFAMLDRGVIFDTN